MYIEEFIKEKAVRPTVKPIAGDPLDTEYIVRPRKDNSGKVEVVHHKAGCVFIGNEGEASVFIRQERTKKALRATEIELGLRRGRNPFITR